MSAPRFAVGQRVRILDRDIGKRHMRTPVYSRNAVGHVMAFHGRFPNPEDLAYHGDGMPALPLYLVRVPMAQLWDDYRGPPGDGVLIDIFEHWLEPADHGA